MNEYKSITLQKNLLNIVDKLVKNKNSMYKSRSEFVHDAIRKRIEELLTIYPDLQVMLGVDETNDK